MNPVRQKMKDQQPDSSPGIKRKGKQKESSYEPGAMVLLPSVPAQSITQYSIALPSANKDQMLDEMDMLRNITQHLNEIVRTMENVYIKGEVKEEGEEEEEEETVEAEEPPEQHEDMTAFLVCCSQLSRQLENALREEKQILESLLKWFEKEVHEMEEIGEEQIIPDWQVPLADKSITDNISKLLTRIQKLEDLKGRVQELPKLIQLSAPKQEKRKPLGPVPPTPKDPKTIIEDLAMKHATEDVMNMVQVFQDDSGQPQTIETMNNRMLEIMKVFERQTNKLHRVANEQDVLEGKLQKIQREFQKLSEEKEIMEEELQKMRASEQDKGVPDSRKKVLPKIEKVKVEEKPAAAPVEKPQKFKQKDPETQKMKEDLAKAKADVETLEQEKKLLEEKLQKALEEAEKAKSQLAEIPPTIPDWHFPVQSGAEDDKDIHKKGKKGAKAKGKVESRTDLSRPSASRMDGAIHKAPKVDAGREGEAVLGKKPELSTTPQGQELADTKAEESKKAGEKGKGKEKRRMAAKGAGIEKRSSPVTALPPLPPIQEKKLSVAAKVEGKEAPTDMGGRETERAISPKQEEGRPDLPPSELQVATTAESEALSLREEIPEILIEEVKDERRSPINEKMLQLADQLAELKGLPEAKDLAKVFLESAKGLEELSGAEGLPISGQLISGLQQPGMPEDEESEGRRKLLSNVMSTLQLLQQAPEPGQSEEEYNEKRSALLANLESKLKDLQRTQPPQPVQPDIGREIRKLSENRNLLLADLESNRKDLARAQALAASEPSELNENKVKELLQRRELLTTDLKANQEELEKAKTLGGGLAEDKHEKEIEELTSQRKVFLEHFKSAMKDLEEAEALEVAHPGSVSDARIRELKEQRNSLVRNLETNLQNLQKLNAATLVEENPVEDMLLPALAKKKNLLQESLDQNLKDLQEARRLTLIQSDSTNERKLQDLVEQRRRLTGDLKATMDDIEEIKHIASQKGLYVKPSEKVLQELHELTEKRKELQKKLEAHQKEMQDARELIATQPDSIGEDKLKELAILGKHLEVDLQKTLDGIEALYRHFSQRGLSVQPEDRDLYELTAKKQELIKKLEQLEEDQFLAISDPGRISDHKLQELNEERRRLAAALETTVHEMLKAPDHVPGRVTATSEKELNRLTTRKQTLIEKLESNEKELLEAQALAATQPDSINEDKLRELTDERRHLIKELDETIHDIVNVARHVSGAEFPTKLSEPPPQDFVDQRKRLSVELKSAMQDIQKAQRQASQELAEKEVFELSMKKKLLQANLEKNLKQLQEAQALATLHPDIVSEKKLQKLTEQRKRLTEALKDTVHDLQKAEYRRSSEKVQIEQIIGSELYDLFEKKQLLQADLESNWKQLQEAQALAATHPGSVSENKLKELTEERQRLTEQLDTTVEDILKVERYTPLGKPAEKELYELSAKKQQLLEDLKDLQEAQALATTQPGSEEKRKQLSEQSQRLAADLEATMQEIQKAQLQALRLPSARKRSEKEVQELTKKKYELMEKLASNRKSLQETQALLALQPDSAADLKLQELAEERKHMTEELKAILHDLQEIQRYAPQRLSTGKPGGRELNELNKKKRQLLENLEANQIDLEEAEILSAIQPGSISKERLEELAEERRRLTADLESTLHKIIIQEVKQHTTKPSETELVRLAEWKQLLLENVETNLKELEEAQALIDTQPEADSEKKIQELKEQRKFLTENLETVVKGVQEMKARISKKGGAVKPVERDLNELLEKKGLYLKRLESNLNDLLKAQTLVGTHPGEISEGKVQDLNEKRRLLAAGLEAIIQDLHDVPGFVPEKIGLMKSRKIALEHLSEKKRLFFENLDQNLRDIKQARGFAAVQPSSGADKKLKKLLEQRRLLTAGLEAIVQNMDEIQDLLSGEEEILKPTEIELMEQSERRKLSLKNMDTKVKELRDLQALAAAEPDEERTQELTKKGQIVAVALEAILQDMQDMQNIELDQRALMNPEERKINDLIVLSALESKIDELQEIGALSDDQLNSIKEKVRKLKEKRKSLIEKWEGDFIDQFSEGRTLVKKEKAIQQFLEKRKSLFSYLQASIKQLKEKGVVQPDTEPAETVSKEESFWDECLMEVPIELLQSEVETLSDRFVPDEEKSVKQRALAAKLEANIKDLQAVFGTDKAQKPKQVVPKEISFLSDVKGGGTAESSFHQIAKPTLSGFDLQVNKMPVTRRIKSGERRRVDESSLLEDDQHIKGEIDLTKQFANQLGLAKTTLQSYPSFEPGVLEVNIPKSAVEKTMQELLEYKNLLPAQKTNLHQALRLAQHQLQLQQQQATALANKFKSLSVLLPQPAGTSRFHEYSLQRPRPVWEASQLPQKDYAQKISMLKRKLLGQEVKGSPPRAQGPVSSVPLEKVPETFSICGKGCSPLTKPQTFPVIKQKTRHF